MRKRRVFRTSGNHRPPIGSLTDLYNWAVSQHSSDDRAAQAVVVTFYHEIKKLQYELEATRKALTALQVVREVVGGIDVRLQEVEEDLYGEMA